MTNDLHTLRLLLDEMLAGFNQWSLTPLIYPIDFENGKVIDSVEATSMNANKTLQQLKEANIRQNGGTYIRDRSTGKLLDISNIKTTIERRN